MTDTGYFLLNTAILNQAENDYASALRCGRQGIIEALERFFLSDWGQALSDYQGQTIINRIRANPYRPHKKI